MSEPIRDRNVDFLDTSRTKVQARSHEGEIEYFDKGEFPGVRFKDWKFKDIDASEKDGALVEIDPGAHTPVQLVEADKVFSDVPLSGKLTFLHMDTEDNIRIYRFDSNRDSDNSYNFEVKKGEIMCWFASSNQEKPAEFIEYEEPGYSPSDLTNIEPGTTNISGRAIPHQFWQVFNSLSEEKPENIKLPIIELGSLQ